MNNCIFAPHCTEPFCDRSCPIFTETSYLLERNNLTFGSPVFQASNSDIQKAVSLLDTIKNGMKVVISEDQSSIIANLLTYISVCKNWQGSRLHCSVFNLRLSNYLDAIQKSWSVKSVNEQLEYEQIWSQTAKVLIISSIDFINFKDFQCQTLLNIINDRKNNGLITIIVSPHIDSLVGSGAFFSKLKCLMEGSVIKW